MHSTASRPVDAPAAAPFAVRPLTPALGAEISGLDLAQGVSPDFIIHATSSGGTQAGLIAGCAIYSPKTRVIGISADDPAGSIRDVVLRLVAGVESGLGLAAGSLGGGGRCEVDDTFVGAGYGQPSDESIVAQQMAARFEALLTDHWYTAKAMAGLMNRAHRGEFDSASEVLFWHTGGQPGAIV